MGEAFENRMALLGCQGTDPGLAFVHLAFELMEDLPDVPTVFVEQDELIDGQGEVGGEVAVGDLVLGIGVNDAPQHHAVGGAYVVVGDDSGVSRLAAVERVLRADFGAAVGSFQDEEVDAMGVLEGVPEVVVDAGFVPDEEDFAALGRSVAKLFGGAAFDDGDVMDFLPAVFGVGHVEATEVVAVLRQRSTPSWQ